MRFINLLCLLMLGPMTLGAPAQNCNVRPSLGSNFGAQNDNCWTLWIDLHHPHVPRLPERSAHSAAMVDDDEYSQANLVSRSLKELFHEIKEVIKGPFLGRKHAQGKDYHTQGKEYHT